MDIVEQFIQGKKPNQEECEDGLFVGEHYIAVVDGATSSSGTKNVGKTPGKLAMELVTGALCHLDPDQNAANAFKFLNKSIVDAYNSSGILGHMESNPIDRWTASCVIYSLSKRELWFIGDCQALIDGVLVSNNKLVDDVTSSARALFLAGYLTLGHTVEEVQKQDVGREYILPLLQEQSVFQNGATPSEFNFAVLDGFFTNVDMIKVIPVPPNVNEMVLASDGYPELMPTLEASEELLKQILKDDPLLFQKYKSAKGLQPGNYSFDDRTYIRIKV